MPSKGKKYGNASQVTVHFDDYGGMKGYKDGGKVKKGQQQKEYAEVKKPKASQKPLSTADAMKNTRARQMKELGL